MRREVNRACELSCDEMLLRRMDDLQRRAYGETLLNMASGAALPAGVVATSFATEKKNLKERLIQIMEFQKTKSKVLASVLAFVLLFSCALFTV
jgi:beta-lactamase regulating signal transducer with metallopeptidase domain